MLPVLSLHPVHHKLAQAIGQVGLHQERSAVLGVHGLVHERVSAGEVEHLIGEVLGGAVLPPGLVGRLTGTLWDEKGPAEPPQHPSLLPLHHPAELAWVPPCLLTWDPSSPSLCQLSCGESHMEPIPADE